LVRRRSLEAIAAYRVGVAVDYDIETLRGLEVHLDPELLRKKAENCRNYATLILDQQRFLRSVVGYCNESILGRMSSLLTHEDRQVALQTAQSDAMEAARIHEIAAAPGPPHPLPPRAYSQQNTSLSILSPSQLGATNHAIDDGALCAIFLRAQFSQL
jgi:hypothetical protein